MGLISHKKMKEPTIMEHNGHYGGRRENKRPALVWEALPWMKLNYFCRVGDTEIAGYGIGSENNPLHIVDFKLIKQKSSGAFFEFDDLGLIAHCEEHQERGVGPDRCYRVWVHTHPGGSAEPSGHDWGVWREKLGNEPWKVMMILARGGDVTAQLRIGGGDGTPKWEEPISVSVDYKREPPYRKMGKLRDAWYREYKRLVNNGPLYQDEKEEKARKSRITVVSPSQDLGRVIGFGPGMTDEEWAQAWDQVERRYAATKPRNFGGPATIKNEVGASPPLRTAIEIVTETKPEPTKEKDNGAAQHSPGKGGPDADGQPPPDREWLGGYLRKGWIGGTIQATSVGGAAGNPVLGPAKP